MKSLARRNELSKSCANRQVNVLIPNPGSISIGRVHILILTRTHCKGSNHLQENHKIIFKDNKKLHLRDNRILRKNKDGKQTRIILTDAVEQIGEILFVILASNMGIMQINVHTKNLHCEWEPNDDE